MKKKKYELPKIYEGIFIPGIKKTFEDVYTSRRVMGWCKLKNVSNDIGIDEIEYRKLMQNICKIEQRTRFDFLIKYCWLSKKFCYKGKLRSKFRMNGWLLDRSFGVYMKCHVGYNNHFITQVNNVVNVKLFSYINDFFPNLMAENPFNKKMKYPYKYMNFECLCLVVDIPERLELLKYGEKKKLKFNQFVDYVFNYVCTINEITGTEIFTLNFSYASHNPHVKYNRPNQIKTSDVPQGKLQLPSPKSISTKSPVEGFGNYNRPA